MSSAAEFSGATPEALWSQLIDGLVADGTIQTARIKAAFLKCARHLLLPEDDIEGRKMFAGIDGAFDNGYGQTISQPTMVAIMTELLQPEPGETALDVGMGSGWQAMILAELVGEEGNVTGMERIAPMLLETRENFERLGIQNIGIIHGDALNPEQVPNGPFDMITCAAGCAEAPDFWINRLSAKGRMIYPKQVGEVRSELFYWTGKDEGQFVKDIEDGPIHQLCITRRSGQEFSDAYHGQPCRYVPLTEGIL